MIKGIIFDFNRTVYDPETSELTKGVLGLLYRLVAQRYRLCLISKKTAEDRAEQISELGLDKYFVDIQVIEGNKTEQNFERCMQVMSLDASEIAVVGDRTREEIRLGKKFGMRTIWYKSGKFAAEIPRGPEEEPDYAVTRLEEMVELLG